MTTFPPNPPEGAVIRVEDAELEEGVTCVVMPCCGFAFSNDHEDDNAETFTCPCCVPSADALAAADSWWRSRLGSDETIEAVAAVIAGPAKCCCDDDWRQPPSRVCPVHGEGSWPYQSHYAKARAVLAALLPVAESEIR